MTMKLGARLVVMLVPMLALGACESEKACKDGTILLTLDLSENAVKADTLAVNVAVAEGAPVVSSVVVPPGATAPTIAVEFPAGYPEGKAIAVDVVATAGGQPVGFGSSKTTAPAGCGTLRLVVLPGITNDGGGDPDASIPTPSDGGSQACVPGALSCRGNIVVTCDANGVLVESEECTGLCSAGSCVGECTPGTMACVGEAARVCSAAGSWSATTPCPAGCADGACLPACAANAARCNGDTKETCTNGAWGTPVACENACRDGACVGECKPTSPPRCTGKVLANCSADAQWVTQETCEFVCTAAGCVGECVPDSKRCNGAAVQVCNSMGSWQDVTTCENACSNGVCTPKVPGMPGVQPTATVTPATAAKVREKDLIVITFSEQMDTTSVEAAFKATTPGAAKPEFRWTPDKTVVTIDPKFSYPKGISAVPAKGSYAFTLGTAAKDANGEALKSAVSATYALLYRRMTPPRVAFEQRDSADRLIAGNLIDGSTSVYTFLQAALQSGTKRNDGFVTFALPSLASNYIIEQVLFLSEIESTAGTATGVGNFRIAETSFGAPLSAAAWNATNRAIGEGLPAAALWKVGAKVQFTVTSAVAADYRFGAATTQFRLYLEGMTVAPTRTLRLLRPQTFLEITYLIE